MKMNRAPLVNERFIPAIKEYCEKRDYRCRGCKWSADKWEKRFNVEHDPYATCLFANCPCSWEVEEKTTDGH